MRKYDYAEYVDKVHGGWYGKCLGGGAGAVLEGTKNINEMNDFTDFLNPDLPNDDLDIQLLWLEILEEYGPNLTQEILAERWEKQCWYTFSEYGYFLKNYELGIKPPVSGWFNNPFFKDGLGCPIRSEIWGYAFIGAPEEAAKYAQMDGELDHSGNSVEAEAYLAALESLAFFYDDIPALFAAAEPYLPKEGSLSKAISLVFEEYERGSSYPEIRRKILRLFGHNDFTNVTQNIAFVIISLLFGGGSLHETLNICLKCGYDTDSTCAMAGAILGTMKGYSRLDDDVKSLINDYFVLGIDVKRPSDSIRRLAEDTCAIGNSIAAQYTHAVAFSNLPQDTKQFSFLSGTEAFTVRVDYPDGPSIGPGEEKLVQITVKNNTSEMFCGAVQIHTPGHLYTAGCVNLQIAAGETYCFPIKIVCGLVDKMPQKNLIRLAFQKEDKNIYEYTFGMAGASLWKMYGPYFEPYEKQYVKHKPVCDFDCAVNNIVFLDKDYKDDEYIKIHCGEDILNISDYITMSGQMCCYLETTIVSPSERSGWLVIGNNDGYTVTLNGEKIQEMDEIRLWTPYNNHVAIQLKKGKNQLQLKLLKRTEQLKFSIGVRHNNGQHGPHWHNNRWCTDLEFQIEE